MLKFIFITPQHAQMYKQLKLKTGAHKYALVILLATLIKKKILT